MKFSSVVLCLSIACATATDNRELRACIKSHSITLQNGICNYDAIAKELQDTFDDDPACRRGTNVVKELRALWMDENMSLDQVKDKVNSACEEAFYQLTFVEGVSYVDILDDSQQMVKEYFDGRGCVNSDHEYNRAQGLGESILTTVPFQWPGDSGFEFDQQLPKNVQSQFPRDYFARTNKDKVNGKKTAGANGHGRTSKRNYGPIQNFDKCKLNTAMCCWQESTDPSEVYGQQQVKRETVDHNTDTCYVDMSEAKSSSRVRAGYSIFPSGLGELMPAAQDGGAVRCHGFNWAEDPMHVSNLFKGNALFQTSFQHHLERGGYVSPISGAPMCGCLEQMPVVTRADCTQIDVGDFDITVEISKGRIEVKMPESNKITFSPCTADPDERRLLHSRRRKLQKEFTKADWFPRIKAEMLAKNPLENIKGCSNQKEAPRDQECPKQQKTCLFETQVCGNGLPYPITVCKCPGGKDALWNCEPYACPEGLEADTAPEEEVSEEGTPIEKAPVAAEVATDPAPEATVAVATTVATQAATEAATEAATPKLTTAPIMSAPVTPPPVTSAPVTSEPTDAPGLAVISLRDHYELMVEKNMIVDKANQVAKRLVGDGGCPRVVASFLRSQGIQENDYLSGNFEEESRSNGGSEDGSKNDSPVMSPSYDSPAISPVLSPAYYQ